jgi:hypothetical protein
VESDYKETRAGDGMVLKLKFECLDPPYTGRAVYENLTLEHPKEETVAIAQANLKSLAAACGHPNPDYVENSEELHNLPVVLKLKKERNPQFGDADGYQNRIVAYSSTRPTTRATTAQAPAAMTRPAQPSDDEIPF